jgi:alcohol dehydrogenase class IV
MPVKMYDCWPKKVVSYPGAIQSLGEIIKSMNKSKVMIFTDKVMKDFPLIANVIDQLKAEGLNVSLFGEIGPNPVVEMVHNAVDYMNQEKPDIIVAIGGGSPIDAAKAANVVYSHGGSVKDYDIAIGGIMKITPKLLPMIAIPTTAGTGSEVTYVGVITDTERQVKFGVLSPLVLPDVAILDPEVTVTMPPKLTAFTGIDALTHSIESYTSCVGFPPADALALHAIRMISRSLRTAVSDGANIKAREEMLVASMMAGTSFSLNGLGACHAMAHQLSAYFDTPHGLANAMLLTRVMKYNLSSNLQKFADIAEAMGADIRNLTVEQAAEKALEMVQQLCADLGVPQYLDDIGASRDKIPELVERAMQDNPITTNPRPATPEDITKLYESAFKSSSF